MKTGQAQRKDRLFQARATACAAIVAVAGLSSRAVAQWIERALSTDGPLVFDSARGVTTLLTSGNGANQFQPAFWEWNGTTWYKRSVPGSAPMVASSIAYDSARGVTVLFGGRINSVDLDETWEWNGAAWTQRLVSGPPARSGHAMAYDSARKVTVLFGSGPNFGADTWEWDGSVWVQRMVASPPGRYGHSMAYDSKRAVTVLFGGYTANGLPFGRDTWEWNGDSWSQRSNSGPEARAIPTMFYDAAAAKTTLVGGLTTTTTLQDVWLWDGVHWSQLGPLAGPAPVAGASAGYDSVRNTAVMHGGFTRRQFTPGTWRDTPLSDTWQRSQGVWISHTIERPELVAGSSMAYDMQRGVVVLFGGQLGGRPDPGYPIHMGSATWEWNGSRWTFVSSAGPFARGYHALAYDADRHVTVLFGGKSSDGYPGSDTWEWDGSVWTQRPVTGPTARFGHAMAYDQNRHRTVLFGGRLDAAGQTLAGDTWEWNGISWAQQSNTGPSPRGDHAMAYDADRALTVLFGGSTSGAYSDETWEWNGVNWTQRLVSGPSARAAHGMVYDPMRHRTLLFGGRAASTNGETWEWDGSTWVQRVLDGPAPRFSHAMAYDPVAHGPIIFGGTQWMDIGDIQPMGDTWVLGPSYEAPAFSSQPASQAVNPGSQVTFMVVAAGSAPLTYRWRHNGADLQNGGRIQGAETPTLRIAEVDSGDAGWYACSVSNSAGSAASAAASLTVTCYANCDGSTAAPVLNINDFICFQSKFAAGDPYANCDGSTSVPILNINDFICFQASFAAGCE